MLEEISRLRELNREKVKKLQTNYAAEQNGLNKEINDYKKQIQGLKLNIHELETNLTDSEAANQLEHSMLTRELQSQKEANEKLRAKNNFLAEWCSELERDLKA